MALKVRVCARVEVAAGQLRAFAVAGVTWPVLVTVIDGEVVAVSGVCPHEDVSLVGGDFDGCRVTCPGHAYEFDLRDGACVHDRFLHLRRYPVQITDDGDVWVDLL